MRVLSVTGGKGGVGKTTIAINLALSFAKQNKQVLLFDADLGLANVDVLLGLKPKRTLADYFAGKCSLKDTCVTGPHGLMIIPAASGVQQMADLSGEAAIDLIHAFSELTQSIDIMLIDLASGISSQVLNFTHAAQDIVVVICNDPASLMDSYAVVKIMHQRFGRERFGVVVNKTQSLQEGFDVFCKFQAVTAKFFDVSMNYLGFIPQDDFVALAARDQVAVVDQFPQAKATLAFSNLAHGITYWNNEIPVTGGIQFFFERLIQPSYQEQLCKA